MIIIKFRTVNKIKCNDFIAISIKTAGDGVDKLINSIEKLNTEKIIRKFNYLASFELIEMEHF
jgi:hypothetical protein